MKIHCCYVKGVALTTFWVVNLCMMSLLYQNYDGSFFSEDL